MATPSRALVALAALALAAAPLAAQEASLPTELTVAFGSRHLSLDPLHAFTAMESQVYTALYEGLLTSDPRTLAPIPGVASRWETTDGGLTWRFYLRTDARYSNGDRVRAGDFVDSWRRMIDPANKAEYSFLFDVIKGAKAWREGKLTDAAALGFRAVSDDVLEVRLERPAAHFLILLTHVAFLPIHPSYVRQQAPWGDGSTLISDGPFTLISRTDAELVLARNRSYWDQRGVALERIRVRFIDDPEVATTEYLAGRVQWSTMGDPQKLTSPDQFEASPEFATTYFFFSCSVAPWGDARVRRALALLLPWDTIRSKDYLYPTSQLVPSIPNYPDVKGIAASDPAEARRLLAAAGFPDGVGLPTLVIRVFDSSSGADMAGAMAAAWKKAIGLTVEVRQLPGEDFSAEARRGEGGLTLSTWIGDYADPLTFLQLFTTGSNLNDAGYSDPGFDAAVDEAVGLQDPAKRYRRMADAEQVLLDSAAVLPIDHLATFDFINVKDVGGWYANLLDIHPFKYIRFQTRPAPANVARATGGPAAT